MEVSDVGEQEARSSQVIGRCRPVRAEAKDRSLMCLRFEGEGGTGHRYTRGFDCLSPKATDMDQTGGPLTWTFGMSFHSGSRE